MNLRHARLTIVVFMLAAWSAAAEPIYGTVTTRDGRRLSGTLRWDRNECFWDDFLDATSAPVVEGEGKPFRFRLFGRTLVDTSTTRRRGVRVAFGHLRSIEAIGQETARLVLKSGETIEASTSGTTDLGPDLRGVELFAGDDPAIALGWSEIARVDFGPPASAAPDPFGPRLHGTVTTMAGVFTGFLAWDKESVLASDPVPFLDASKPGGEAKRFADLRSIDQFGGGGARAQLRNGTSLPIAARRSIEEVEIVVPGLGRVRTPWEAVRQVVFSAPPPSPAYGAFDGGRPLTGRLTLTDGSLRSGAIVWDDDETSTQATLDAEIDGIEYSIAFAELVSVLRLPEASKVRLRDGRDLVLRGTNDVDASNRGIGITTAGAERELVPWDRVTLVEFQDSE